MARENQGLQIALIVFVTLFLFTGVAAYLLYRQYDEAASKAKTSAESASTNKGLADAKDADITKLKKMIGAAPADKVDSMDEAFIADMKSYGGPFAEEKRFYRPLLEVMQKTIDDKNKELSDVQKQIPKLEEDYKEFMANRDLQLKKFEAERDKAVQDLAAEQAKFNTERDRKNQDALTLQTSKEDQRKKLEGNLKKIQDDLTTAETHGKKLGNIVDVQGTIIAGMKGEGEKVQTPDGEITRVDQRNRTVWINLGRADALTRQITFSVYPGDMRDMSDKGIKGKIEITQILDEHLAEARILDDVISDPLVPGDKVNTVLWSPNERKHFALAGFFDIDGDGKSDLATVLNIIKLNGGVVDCFIPDSGKDKGKVVGQVSLNTNFLILGSAPNEKGDATQLTAYSKIYDEAKQIRIPTMKIGDMLQRMGWKNLAPVIHFGRGGNPEDFRAKPEDGTQKKSIGGSDDTFKQRQPPTKAPPSAYHRI